MKRRRLKSKSFVTKRIEQKSKKRFFLAILIIAIFIYALSTWFLPVLIGSLSVFNRLKPVHEKETPVSDSIVLAPPVLNIPYEATNTAQIKVTGYSLAHCQVEIYLDDELQTIAETHEDGGFATDAIALSLGTNNIFGKTIDSKGNSSLSSKPIKIIYTNENPTLELKEPYDNQTITGGDKKVIVSGTTDSNKDIVITINNMRAVVGPDGDFSQSVELQDGDNEITIIAKNSVGNTTEIGRKVIYQP